MLPGDEAEFLLEDMVVMMRRSARLLVVGAMIALSACGGDAAGEEADEDPSTTVDESTSTTIATTTTLSPEEQVLADYEAAQAAITAAFDPPDPDHPDLLATLAGEHLDRVQVRLSQYELEGRSDVLISKQSDPRVISIDDTTAVVENCVTEILQYTDTETREPLGEQRTYTALLNVDLELIDGTWKIVDGETIDETC